MAVALFHGSMSRSRAAATSAPAKFGIRPCGGNGKRTTPLATSLSQTHCRAALLSAKSRAMTEGARLTNAVIDLIGDHVLMYASDYPHGESHFPESVSLVLDWKMDSERKRRLLWDNAVRFYARAPV
jgi:hypothetical protein